jgi:hypothetical protein
MTRIKRITADHTRLNPQHPRHPRAIINEFYLQTSLANTKTVFYFVSSTKTIPL